MDKSDKTIPSTCLLSLGFRFSFRVAYINHYSCSVFHFLITVFSHTNFLWIPLLGFPASCVTAMEDKPSVTISLVAFKPQLSMANTILN